MTLELDTAASHWQLALDASETALSAEAGTLPAAELAGRRAAVQDERRRTAVALVRLAHTAHVHPDPWVAGAPVTHAQLGLEDDVRACIFDLDGVLTDSGLLHAWAWGRVFDEFLRQHSERAHWSFIPFDRDADYRAYLDGRPRLDGVHAFLTSRGIRLPEGQPTDPAGAPTAHGLARAKQETLASGLHERGMAAVPGARRYLEAAGHVGLKRAVVSSSTSTEWMLELAGLTTVVDAVVDASVMRDERLRSRPAPDVLLCACDRLDVDPEHAVSFTHTPAGSEAAGAASITVIPFASVASLLAPSLASA